MPVTSSTRTASKACNGVTVSFALGFGFDHPSDLEVDLVAPDESVTALTYPGQFNGTAHESNGTLTTATAHPSGATLNVRRVTTPTQERTLNSLGKFDVVAVVAALDRLTMGRIDETAFWSAASTAATAAATAAAASAAAASDDADAAAASETAAAGSASTASTSATNAASSATAAAGSATDAAGSATAAAGSASDASDDADAAAASATAAASSATAAASSATAAAGSASNAATAQTAAEAAQAAAETAQAAAEAAAGGTVADDSITNAKLANVATGTIKGRTTSGTGDPEDLTPAQARGVLNVAEGATANASDASLRDRSTHTGTQAASTISDFSSTVSGNATVAGALQRSGGTMTGLLTVAGVKVANGSSVSGTLTSAAHSGGVFVTGGNCTLPNEAGFSITLIAGGAHDINVGTGAAVTLAAGDLFSVAIPVAGTVKAVRTLAADVITMAVS